MRQIRVSNKKLRGTSRRLRALKRWADDFEGWFPEDPSPGDRKYVFKIPVHVGLVEGRDSSQRTRRECAQRLIDACSHLVLAKPKDVGMCRVVARVCIPDMFSSEVCIYTDANYYRSQVSPSSSRLGKVQVVRDRKLSADWGLTVPPHLDELGLSHEFPDIDGAGVEYRGVHWLFGEL